MSKHPGIDVMVLGASFFNLRFIAYAAACLSSGAGAGT